MKFSKFHLMGLAGCSLLFFACAFFISMFVVACSPTKPKESQEPIIKTVEWMIDESKSIHSQIKGKFGQGDTAREVTLNLSTDDDSFNLYIQDTEEVLNFKFVTFKISLSHSSTYTRIVLYKNSTMVLNNKFIVPLLLQGGEIRISLINGIENINADYGRSYFFEFNVKDFSEVWTGSGRDLIKELPPQELPFAIRKSVDDFGKETGKIYLSAIFTGKYSNKLLNNNANARLHLIVNDDPYIYMDEYSINSYNKALLFGSANIKIRDAIENDYEKECKTDDDNNINTGKWIISILQKEENLRIRINNFSSSYAFDNVNIKGFNEMYSVLKNW